MESMRPLSRDHLLTLHALEVLRLMADRVERNEVVDIEDVQFVFRFLGEVAHGCLDHTEELLLRPALAKAAAANHSAHLGSTLTNHEQARVLFGQLVGKVNTAVTEEFVPLSRSYTGLLSDLLFDEDRFLPDLVRSVFTDGEDRQKLDAFEVSERGVGEFALKHGQAIHRLQLKYISPHCI